MNTSGSEDCLFLNVYAPKMATKLPVMIWIHGGGYGQGDGGQDQSLVINATEGAFLVVSIQYRVSIFHNFDPLSPKIVVWIVLSVFGEPAGRFWVSLI